MDIRRFSLEYTSDTIFKETFVFKFLEDCLQQYFRKTQSKRFINRDLTEDAKTIAEQLYNLYQEHINTLSGESNRYFATLLAITLTELVMTHKAIPMEKLFDRPSLHYLLISFSHKIPKETLRKLSDHEKCNARGYITKSAISCEEERKLYINKETRLEKYGVTYFETKKEWERFKKLSTEHVYYRADTLPYTQNTLFFNNTNRADNEPTQCTTDLKKNRTCSF